MQRSKLDIGRADARAGGMSIRSGMGASSSSSDASAIAQSTWSSGAGSGSMCLEKSPEKDPRFSFFARVQHVVQCGSEPQDRGRRDGPAVLRRDVVSALLRQDGVCLGRLLDQHVQRATVHAEGDRECRFLLCVAPQGLLHVAV